MSSLSMTVFNTTLQFCKLKNMETQNVIQLGNQIITRRYSRTLVAQTLMARLPRLFQTSF